MVSKIFNKLIRLLKPDSMRLTNLWLILNLFLYYKITRLRIKRKAAKFNILNLRTFKKKLDKEETVENCTIDKLDFKSNNDLINKSSKILKNYGIVLIKNAFHKNEIETFLEAIEEISPKKKYHDNKIDHEYEISNNTIPIHKNKFLFDDRIIKTIENSCNDLNQNEKFKEKLYVRQMTKLIYFNTKKENIVNNWTAGWHVDFPTQFTAHVLLDDLNENQTRMQALPSSNLIPLIPSKHYFLEHLVLDKKRNILECCGPKGTLYIHSGNTLHRNFPIINTYRFVWSQVYTLDKIFFASEFSKKKRVFENSKNYIDNLTDYQKEKIIPLIEYPKEFENKIFKYDNEKFFEKSKNDISYL